MKTQRIYVNLPTGQVHCRIARCDGKPWLVLLHQSPSSSAMFETLIPYLSEHFQVLAPDNPGFGQSDPIHQSLSAALQTQILSSPTSEAQIGPPQSVAHNIDGVPAFAGMTPSGQNNIAKVTIAALSETIVAVMAALNIPSAFIFGHHTGAAIAGYLGAHHGHTCQAIAMCGPPALNPEQRKMLPAMAPVETPQADGEHLMRMWAKLRSKETNAPPAISTRELGLAFASHATAQTYQAVADYDFMGDLETITCPLLLFAGERDSLVGYLDAAANTASQATILKIEDAGGYICDLRPDLVAQLLIDFFLQGHPQP